MADNDRGEAIFKQLRTVSPEFHTRLFHRPDCPIIDDLADLTLEKPVSATLRGVA
jgi:hypothetical protein